MYLVHFAFHAAQDHYVVLAAFDLHNNFTHYESRSGRAGSATRKQELHSQDAENDCNHTIGIVITFIRPNYPQLPENTDLLPFLLALILATLS